MPNHIIFASSSKRKINEATGVLGVYNIEVESRAVEIDEIQHHEYLEISKAKARTAFAAIGEPLVINDSSWSIPALGGFPGGYMKDMMGWLTAKDFLALMQSKTDRTIFLHDITVYIDKTELRVFENTIKGSILTKPQGNSPVSINKIIAMDADKGKSIAEIWEEHEIGKRDPYSEIYKHWHDFGKWYTNK